MQNDNPSTTKEHNGFIELHHIKKSYKEEIALDIPHLKIPLQGVIAIMGYSGAGKSTFISIIGLIDTPDELYIDDDNAPQKPSILFSYQW